MSAIRTKYILAIEDYFRNQGTPTEDQLSHAMELMFQFPDYKGLASERQALEETLKGKLKFNSEYEDFSVLDGRDESERWLHERKSQIEWELWERYVTYLKQDSGFPPRSIYKLNELTDEILDRIGNPESSRSFDVRGMVVGNVQSGKTANFVGLVNKAFDAGYKLVIIFAGIHSSLRSQTQLRVDAGVRGRDSKVSRAAESEASYIGVGKYNQNPKIHSLTSSEGQGDFSRTSGMSNNTEIGGDPVIAVVKKNVNVLKNLIKWLERIAGRDEVGNKRIKNVPVLIIDDEADNASVNTKRKREEISTTNLRIRQLLQLFEQKTYVGYTATPFANIFIPDIESEASPAGELGADLFPKDFIITLPPPPNYIGAIQFFGLDPDLGYEEAEEISTLPEEAIIHVSDQLEAFPPKHKKMDSPPEEIGDLPDSLIYAVKCFVLNCVIRATRGQESKHNSMLVHVSYFVRWQKRVKELLGQYMDETTRRVRFQRGQSFISDLKAIYEEQYVPITRKVLDTFPQYSGTDIRVHEWEQLEKNILEALGKIRVMDIHGEATDVLDYEDHKKHGISVIAVGGNKLSRGLTLEGLSISYFLRSSRTYDTLLQMGRWFGYRPGYLDLCRLFTTPELLEWFQFITMANAELWSDLKYMNQTRAKPLDFGLKVRKHSSGLQITARNKQVETNEVEINFSNRLRESHKLFLNREIVLSNLQVFRNLLKDLSPQIPIHPVTPDSSSGKPVNHLYWQNIKPDLVTRFLAEFQLPKDVGFSGSELAQYIEELNRKGELVNWSILMVNTKGNSIPISFRELPGFEIGKTLRRHDDDSKNPKDQYTIRKAHIISKNHEWIDLSANEYQWALSQTISAWKKTAKKKTTPTKPSGPFIRGSRPAQRGLLLLYVLDQEGYPATVRDQLKEEEPIIGFAISFPESKHADVAIYRVRTDFLESLTNDEGGDED